jgi:drug/metabolite transporter (DMT)-like permease
MAIRLLLLIILISLIKGGVQTAVKVAEEGFPPFGLVGWRNLTAAVFMGGGALLFQRFRQKEAWWPSAGLGPVLVPAVLLTICLLCFFLGMTYTAASRATVLASAQPMVVLVLARIVLPSEKITLWKVAGLVAGLAGILILFFSNLLGEGERASLVGDTLIFVAAFFWAVQSVYEKRILPRYRPFTLVWYQITFSAVILLLLWIIFERGQPIVLDDGKVIFAFLYLVFPVMILVYLGYMYVLQYTEVSRISYFNFVMTVSGVVFGVVLLKEPVTIPLIASVLLVSGGVILILRREA